MTTLRDLLFIFATAFSAGFAQGPPVITTGGIVDAASYQMGVAPGSMIAIFGLNLAPATMQAPATPLPSSLNGVSVSVGGLTAPLSFVSATQINAQLPFAVPLGVTYVIVQTAAGFSKPVKARVVRTTPGLFTWPSSGLQSNQTLLRVRQTYRPAASGVALAEQLAAELLGTQSRGINDMLQAINVGVYRNDGSNSIPGGERGCLDYYAYEFEVQNLVSAAASKQSYTLDQLNNTLLRMGMNPSLGGNGRESVRQALVAEVQAAMGSPSDPSSIIPLLVRQLGLVQNYDLAQDPPASQLHFSALQKYLILLDAGLGALKQITPQQNVGSLLAATSDVIKSNSAFASGNPCGNAGAGGNLASWNTGTLFANLVKNLQLLPAQLSQGTIVDGLHSETIALGMKLTPVTSAVGPVHYGHGAPGQTQIFGVLVESTVEPSQSAVAAGWLAGITVPSSGPVANYPVNWVYDSLIRHGDIQADVATGTDGVARLSFTPRQEMTAGLGNIQKDEGAVGADIDVPTNTGFGLGATSEGLQANVAINWQVTYHDQSEPWQGSVRVLMQGEKTPSGCRRRSDPYNRESETGPEHRRYARLRSQLPGVPGPSQRFLRISSEEQLCPSGHGSLRQTSFPDHSVEQGLWIYGQHWCYRQTRYFWPGRAAFRSAGWQLCLECEHTGVRLQHNRL